MLTTINGTKLKRCNVNGNKCKRINVNGVRVWSADVTLVNNVGSSEISCGHTYDISGGQSGTDTLLTVNNVVAGHRYFIRCGNVRNGETTNYSRIVVTDNNQTTTLSETYGGTWDEPTRDNIIYTAKSASMIFQHQHSGAAKDVTYFAGTQAYLFMVVDLTELEETVGTQYTATTFWEKIGGTEFYNTKVVEI